jgi:hypothetical protein
MHCGGVAGRQTDPVSTPAGALSLAGTRAIDVAAPGGATVIQRPPNCGNGKSICFRRPSTSV